MQWLLLFVNVELNVLIPTVLCGFIYILINKTIGRIILIIFQILQKQKKKKRILIISSSGMYSVFSRSSVLDYSILLLLLSY